MLRKKERYVTNIALSYLLYLVSDRVVRHATRRCDGRQENQGDQTVAKYDNFLHFDETKFCLLCWTGKRVDGSIENRTYLNQTTNCY
jgi:hypothetical protein